MKMTVGQLRSLIREVAYSGLFKKGDHVLFGKYKNKKGKIVDLYQDDKGHPTLEIEPIPKGRKKNVTMGLYKVWKSDEKFDEEKLSEARARESRFEEIAIGPARGSPEKGYTVRLTKYWAAFENEMAWFRLRKILVKNGSDAEHDSWIGPEYGVGRADEKTFLDLPLRAVDPENAELERQALIGDLERARFKVNVAPVAKPERPKHPYR